MDILELNSPLTLQINLISKIDNTQNLKSDNEKIIQLRSELN
mgnify:CR=1 FL=1